DRLQDILGNSRQLDAEQAIFRQGETYPYAVVILDGWAHRYKLLADGRKQTFNFILPGETAG
nr:cyclic nucleotide-binding domain-containing protein [Desulfuromonadales bacterium]